MLGPAVAARAKLRAAAGEYDAMLDELRVLRAMGDQLARADESFMVEVNTGLGMTRRALEVARQAVGEGSPPNLYWALAAADVTADPLAVLQLEREGMYATVPDLRRPEVFDADDWVEFYGFFIFMEPGDGSCGGPTVDEQAVQRMRALAAAEEMESTARSYLVVEGVDVGEMDRYEAVARWLGGTYEAAWRELARAASLPIDEALPAARAALERHADSPAADMLPPLDGLLVQLGTARRERAALMAVEAIRDHAASAGELPTSLDEVELPILADPLTDQPFGYARDRADSATLTAPAVEGEADLGFAWTLVLEQD